MSVKSETPLLPEMCRAETPAPGIGTLFEASVTRPRSVPYATGGSGAVGDDVTGPQPNEVYIAVVYAPAMARTKAMRLNMFGAYHAKPQPCSGPATHRCISLSRPAATSP